MTGLHDLRKSNLFRAAIAVLTLITLIFSLFNPTAPLDPESLPARSGSASSTWMKGTGSRRSILANG